MGASNTDGAGSLRIRPISAKIPSREDRASEDVHNGGLHTSEPCEQLSAHLNGTTSPTQEKERCVSVPSRLILLTDPANICTLTGAIFSTGALTCMFNGQYPLGIFLMMMANLMDIFDGQIARALPGRHPGLGVIGAKMDTYTDTVSHFVVPAALLINLSGHKTLYILLGSLWICTGIVRQSYFEVCPRSCNNQCIFGITSDYMPVVTALAMHLLYIIGQEKQLIVLCVAVMIMIWASLSMSIRSRRYSGMGLIVVSTYNISLTISCLIQIVWPDTASIPIEWSSFTGLSFILHLLLAYPCYFQYVELNRNEV